MSPDTISLDDFVRVDLRVGTVISAEPNVAARKPAYVLQIDLGRLGLRVSSAQITDLYEPAELVGRQMLCVCNLAPKRIAGVTSEVLVLGAYDLDERVVLAGFEHAVPNGARLS
ncbi:MAG: tRNA-binding protein [Mycobacteriaceae bacterium]